MIVWPSCILPERLQNFEGECLAVLEIMANFVARMRSRSQNNL